MLLGLAAGLAEPVVGQGDPGAAPAFSDQILATLGLPEIDLRQPADGPVQGVPAEVAAGRYLVSLTSDGEVSSYVDFVQIPTGISEAEATAQMLDTARNDVPHEGYLYGGGSYALANGTVRFVVDLEAGDWYVAASRQAGQGGEEIMDLVSLAVTGGTPTAAPVAGGIPTAVTLELRDVAFGGLDRPVRTGPQVWEVTNRGEQPRQVVFWRSPGAVTAEQVREMMTGLMAGTPTAGGVSFDQFTWVGYAAILSPGRTIWQEYNFEAGNYLVASYVIDPATDLPALMQGMVQPFVVEGQGAPPTASPEPTPACNAAASPGRVVAVANDVTIRLTDDGFDPAVIQATSGHDLTVTLVNTGSRPHAFVLEDFGIDVQLPPGASEAVTLHPGDRGDSVTYTFASDAPGDDCVRGMLVFYI